MSPDPAASLSDAQRRSLETVLELLAAERASVSSGATITQRLGSSPSL